MLNSITLPPVANEWIDKVGGPRRAMIFGVGIGSVLLILGLARWAAAPTWVPVYSDLPLESVGTITDRLDEAGIPFKLEAGGTELVVASTDLARTRVTLARDGGLPSAGRPGMELFDQPSWGMTDFTQRVNYHRAIEGELERTIGEMRGIEAVKVHLAIDDSPGFRAADKPAEASVVLTLRSGAPAAPEVVQGITHLVASSVDGMDAGRVSVLDDTGRLLSTPYAPGSPAALANRELEMRREIERYLEQKAERLVGEVAGASNVQVQVSADINFDKVQRTTEIVDPEQQALATEQRAEIIPGAEGGAGSTSLTASYMNSRTMETFSGAIGDIERLTVAVLLNDPSAAGEGATPWTADQLARIETLVQNAVGVNAERGDVISVVSIPFQEDVTAVDGTNPWVIARNVQKPAITVFGLLLAFILALKVIRALKEQPEPALIAEVETPALAAPTEEESEMESLLAEPALPDPSAGVRKMVTSRIKEHPETSIRLVRSWLKEA
ncbi:MAG TPA: flagellar basal-body MS-ring/collar protein FliF [Longimicrobiaceae bacterium]|nr:flagellar basal-body MS-ring/collar protein FliF [Longimicrobiaceae bacterium]